MREVPLPLVARLAAKELREILRDRRTVITLVLMPVLLYPLLGVSFNYFLTTVTPSPKQQYKVAIRTDAEERLFSALLGEKRPNDLVLLRVDKWVGKPDLEEALASGEADIALELKGTERRFPPVDPDPMQHFEVTIIRRDDSPAGLRAQEFIAERLTEMNVRVLKDRLSMATGVRNPAIPIQFETKLISTEETGKVSYLSALIPLVLVLMTITGAVYPSIDLTAGERERGTLELLVAAPVPRMALLLGKYVAVITVAVLTGVINLTMMTATILASGLAATIFPDGGITVGTVLAVLALLTLFAAFFSAVLLAVTSFARSFKEAQAYLIPLMLAAIAPGLVSLLGVRLGGLISITPLLNVVLLAKEILEGGAPLGQGLIVVLSTLFYAFFAIGVAARLFGAEAVLYSEQAHWSDLFRRPRQPRDVAPVGAALMCLALLFPLSFLANGALGTAVRLTVEAQMVLLALAFALLFLGVPLISAYASRVRIPEGFRLGAPPTLAMVGGLLLGLSLWPMALELVVLQEHLGLTTPAALRVGIEAAAARWRSSPWLVLVGMAIVPGLVEEFFFRGYLFNSLAAETRPRNAILISAALFGAFHLFLGGAPLLQRFLPSALMGVVLAWVCWRSGSIWPGALLHAIHNGLLLATQLFPDALGGVGRRIDEAGHVPALWLLGGAVGAAAGIALVWSSRRRPLAGQSCP